MRYNTTAQNSNIIIQAIRRHTTREIVFGIQN